jgi:hypothetical protein
MSITLESCDPVVRKSVDPLVDFVGRGRATSNGSSESPAS